MRFLRVLRLDLVFARRGGQVTGRKILADDAAAGFLWLLPNLVVTKADVEGVDANAPSLSFDMTGAVAPPN